MAKVDGIIFREPVFGWGECLGIR